MGKDSGSAPAAPDPALITGLQSAADRNRFNYETAANRYNTNGPDSSTTWSQQNRFDEAGYNNAQRAWQEQNPQGRWVPGREPSISYEGESQSPVSDPGEAGHWEGAGTSSTAAPDRSAFTSTGWTQNNTLSPGAQRLHDANQSAQTGQASLVDALTRRFGANPYSNAGAPGLVSNIGSPDLQTPNQGSINRGGLVSNIGSSDLQTPNQGSINRGNIQSNAGLEGYIAKLGALDPKQFSQEAGDATYKQNTRYLDVQTGEQQKALEARLSEQGFVPGTPGYDQAMKGFQDTNARAYADARDRSTIQGFNVGHTQFGDSTSGLQAQIAAALSGGAFHNTAQGQDFNQQDRIADRDRQNGLDANAVSQALFDNRGKAGAFHNTAQEQDFNQQNHIADRDRQGGLDANAVSQALFDDRGKAGAFNNASRTQSIAELLQEREQPLRELNLLRQGSSGGGGSPGVPNAPNGYTGGVQQGTGVQQAYRDQYQGLLDTYNAGVNTDNANTGAAAGIISAIAIAI